MDCGDTEREKERERQMEGSAERGRERKKREKGEREKRERGDKERTDELGEAFSQRHMAKSKLENDEQNYRSLRNYDIKLNRKKKKHFTKCIY